MTTQFGNVCLMKTTKMASDQTTQLYKFDMKQMKMRPTFFKLVKLVTVSFQDLRSMLWQGEVQRHRALVEHLNG